MVQRVYENIHNGNRIISQESDLAYFVEQVGAKPEDMRQVPDDKITATEHLAIMDEYITDINFHSVSAVPEAFYKALQNRGFSNKQLATIMGALSETLTDTLH